MSEPRAEERRDGRSAALPGCAVAAYASVVVFIFVVGSLGFYFGYFAVFTSWDVLRPNKLVYGGLVEAGTLKPMREAGLLGPTEVPDAFHGEGLGGRSACAISTGRLLRLDGGEGQQIPLSTITAVRIDPDGSVVATGPNTTVTCPFGPDEGGERFARMLQVPSR